MICHVSPPRPSHSPRLSFQVPCELAHLKNEETGRLLVAWRVTISPNWDLNARLQKGKVGGVVVRAIIRKEDDETTLFGTLVTPPCYHTIWPH